MFMDHTYETCIEACLAYAAACDYCASACLKERDVHEMVRSIQLDMEWPPYAGQRHSSCAPGSEHANTICQLCADICNACAEECNKHNVDHCKRCASICISCAEECAVMTAA